MIQVFESIQPIIHDSVFIAPSAWVIGEVEIGEGSSVWFGTVIRGDVNYIKIGARTNVQDLSMLHVTNREAPQPAPLVIGDDVTIGHRVITHGCTIGNRCLIGMGSIILDGAVIEDDCIIGAGSVVTPRTKIPSGHMAFGNPAKIIRPLRDNEKQMLILSAAHYQHLASIYRSQLLSI